MDLNTLLQNKDITKYYLSKVSGIPSTTIMDICSGKSKIEKCNAKTIFKLSKALNCTMEDLLMLDEPNAYDKNTGKPTDKSYLECGLPDDLNNSINKMKKSWHKIDSGEDDWHWDLIWCELNADINSAEVEQIISSEQAWYLREKYLRMKRD